MIEGFADDVTTKVQTHGWARRLLFLGPALGFVALVVLLGVGLELDPRLVPSPLVGKPVPDFSLPPVLGRELGLARTDLTGRASLVNVFVSWCVACRQEHPLLLALDREGVVPIHGLNYKDRPADATAWGVYGVPETFVIDSSGRIVYKHVGPLTPVVLEEMILPLVRSADQSR